VQNYAKSFYFSHFGERTKPISFHGPRKPPFLGQKHQFTYFVLEKGLSKDKKLHPERLAALGSRGGGRFLEHKVVANQNS